MNGVSWIKLQTNIFDNDKIIAIEDMPEGDAILVIWLKILALAGKCNRGGMIFLTTDIPYTEQLLSNRFRKPLSVIRLALSTFVHLSMIEIVDDIIMVSNWEHYQNEDRLTTIREHNRLAKQKSREKQKLALQEKESTKEKETSENEGAKKKIYKEGVNDMSLTCPGHNSFAEELDSIDELNKQAKPKKSNGKNIPPTLEEVEEYINQKGYAVDAESFIAHYESNGWMVGKAKMQNWHSALVTWNKNEKNNVYGKKQNQSNIGNTHKNPFAEMAMRGDN